MNEAQQDATTGVVEQVSGVVWQQVDDGVMLLDVAKGEYFELNASGARMFELLLQAGSIQQVQTQLLTEFEIDEAQLCRDLEQLINALRSAELIK